MYIEQEIADHRHWYNDDKGHSTFAGKSLLGWIVVAFILYLVFFRGSTTRIIVLGMLAVPIIGLAIFLGVPYVTISLFGHGLTPTQRLLLSVGAIAGTLWIIFKLLDLRK